MKPKKHKRLSQKERVLIQTLLKENQNKYFTTKKLWLADQTKTKSMLSSPTCHIRESNVNLVMKIPFIFLVLLFFASLGVCAQEDFFKGIVLDAKSRTPVAFATIRIQGKAVGVISNEDGSFRIPTWFKASGDNIEISSMGYEKQQTALSTFKLGQTNVVLLAPALFELEEAVVTAKLKTLSAEEIVQYAINNLYNNYPDETYAYLGYYRDYQRKNDTYINLNEAIISVLDHGFKSIDTVMTNFLIHEYKENRQFKIDSLARQPYDYKDFTKIVPGALLQSRGGNELMLLRVHDPIRNNRIKTFSYVYNLREDFIKNHTFSLSGTTYYDNKKVYKIKFRADFEPYLANGIIYIAKEDFAIRKFFYEVNEVYEIETVLGKKTSYTSTRTKNIVEDKGVLFRILIEYKELGDKLFLNYISFKNKFRVARPPLFSITSLEVDSKNKNLRFTLNKPLSEVKNLKLRNIKVHYDGQEVPLKDLTLVGPDSFTVTPNFKQKKDIPQQKKLFSTFIDPNKEKLKVVVKKIKDKEGNILQEPRLEELYQFREFFVQSPMEPNNFKGHNTYFMQKELPLFSASQPVLQLPESKTYWMNTPLQSIEITPKF